VDVQHPEARQASHEDLVGGAARVRGEVALRPAPEPAQECLIVALLVLVPARPASILRLLQRGEPERQALAGALADLTDLGGEARVLFARGPENGELLGHQRPDPMSGPRWVVEHEGKDGAGTALGGR